MSKACYSYAATMTSLELVVKVKQLVAELLLWFQFPTRLRVSGIPNVNTCSVLLHVRWNIDANKIYVIVRRVFLAG